MSQSVGDIITGYVEDVRPLIIPQIETQAGVEAIKEIIEIEGLEAVFIGPYDLSVDLGIPGNFQHPKFLPALDVIKKTCLYKKKMLGFHQVQLDPEALNSKIDEGYNFIAYGIDTIGMRSSLFTLRIRKIEQ